MTETINLLASSENLRRGLNKFVFETNEKGKITQVFYGQDQKEVVENINEEEPEDKMFILRKIGKRFIEFYFLEDLKPEILGQIRQFIQDYQKKYGYSDIKVIEKS